MSSFGKRQKGRAKGVSSTLINPDSRIFINCKYEDVSFSALVDTGAVSSFINPETANRLARKGGVTCLEDIRIALANGSQYKVDTSFEMKIRVGRTKVKHKFLVLPGLSHSMLIGMDLLKKLKFSLLVNNQDIQLVKDSFRIEVCEVGSPGLKSLDPDQEKTLDLLLEKEKARFKEIKGCTPLIKHEIRLEDQTPIKQRYQPRNPVTQDKMREEALEMLKQKSYQKISKPVEFPSRNGKTEKRKTKILH